MLRDWLISNAATVTRVAVALVYLLAALVGFTVLAGLVVAFRPEYGYMVAMAPLLVTLFHTQTRPVNGRCGRPVGAHRLAA